MRAYFEATVYCSTARLAAEQSETKFRLPADVKRANRVKFDNKAKAKVVYNYINNQTCVFNQLMEQSKLDKFFSPIAQPQKRRRIDCANSQDSQNVLLVESDTNIHSKTDEVEDLLCSNSDSTLNPTRRGSSSTSSSTDTSTVDQPK